MRIEPHANLTITLIERHTFGLDRLRGSVPRRGVPIPPLYDTPLFRSAPAGPADCPVLAPPCVSPSSATSTAARLCAPPVVEQLPSAPPTVQVVYVPIVGNLLDILA